MSHSSKRPRQSFREWAEEQVGELLEMGGMGLYLVLGVGLLIGASCVRMCSGG